jgi:hypothetical protein
MVADILLKCAAGFQTETAVSRFNMGIPLRRGSRIVPLVRTDVAIKAGAR